MKRIQEICFLVNGFLLGSLAPLYGKTFNYFLLFMVLFHAVTQWNSFVKELRVGKKYILVFGIYFIYILVQSLFMTWGCTFTDKPYYGIFEDLLLNFILIPIYVVSLKEYLTPRLLARFLFLFCTGYMSFLILSGLVYLQTLHPLLISCMQIVWVKINWIF